MMSASLPDSRAVDRVVQLATEARAIVDFVLIAGQPVIGDDDAARRRRALGVVSRLLSQVEHGITR